MLLLLQTVPRTCWVVSVSSWTCAPIFPPHQHAFCRQFPNFDLCYLALILWGLSVWWLKVMGWISETDISLSSDFTGDGAFLCWQQRWLVLCSSSWLVFTDPAGGKWFFEFWLIIYWLYMKCQRIGKRKKRKNSSTSSHLQRRSQWMCVGHLCLIHDLTRYFLIHFLFGQLLD